MKLPRDLSGEQLAVLLVRYGYGVNRRKGSHIRLTTQINGEHHITIPAHDSLRVGTLSGVLLDVAQHLGREKREIAEELFG